MFLYELALELGVRSTELIERAHTLGISVDPTAKLTAEQVEQLRSAYGKGRAQLAQSPVLDPSAGSGAGGGPMGVPAVAALVLAGLVVALVLGYMVTNSGSDTVNLSAEDAAAAADDETTPTTAPCDETSAGIGIGAIGQDPAATTSAPAAPADAGSSVPAATTLPPCDVVGGLSGDEIAGPSTSFTGDPLDLPRDKQEFCRAALSMTEFEMRINEAANLEALGPIRDVILEGRDTWKSDLVVLEATAPPRLDNPVERYGIVYTTLFDSVVPGADDYSLAVAFVQASRTDLAYYTNQIATAIIENCDKR